MIGMRISPVPSISVLVEEWIALLTSDPDEKGMNFLNRAYNEFLINPFVML
jgi:hypothetical protein